MTTGWTLETIFTVLNYPKVRGAPPPQAVELERFTDTDYHQALHYFKNLKLRAESSQGVKRIVHYYERAGRWWLSIVETKPKKETAQEH